MTWASFTVMFHLHIIFSSRSYKVSSTISHHLIVRKQIEDCLTSENCFLPEELKDGFSWKTKVGSVAERTPSLKLSTPSVQTSWATSQFALLSPSDPLLSTESVAKCSFPDPSWNYRSSKTENNWTIRKPYTIIKQSWYQYFNYL